ncbi:uncharacterized protein LOC135948362 [Cloeon dipterum]|uniref:uncharacterized protein LOC135948362 n=1 Tax=Cloeon dipterum TaxID=197152 RepID=UPI00322034E5
MHTAATLLLFLMMGMIAPFSCKHESDLPSSFKDIDGKYAAVSIDRPDRPRHFVTADELKLYLDQLRTYYAMAGRPRFGKRDPILAVQQHHTLSAGKSRELHHVTLPEDDYGDSVGQPFYRTDFADGNDEA